MKTDMTIAARYEDGVFKPLQNVEIQDGVVVEVTIRASQAIKPKSIRDLGFAGMWADREEVTDGVAYVDRLRDNPRG